MPQTRYLSILFLKFLKIFNVYLHIVSVELVFQRQANIIVQVQIQSFDDLIIAAESEHDEILSEMLDTTKNKITFNIKKIQFKINLH